MDGGPPDPPDLTSVKIGRLEEDMKEVRSDIRTLSKDMALLRADLAFLRGRLEHLPTTWTLIGTVAVSQVSLLGFVFAMIKYLAH